VAKREAVAKAKAELSAAKRVSAETERRLAAEAKAAKEAERLAKLSADAEKARAAEAEEKARVAAESKAAKEAEAASRRAAAAEAKALREAEKAERIAKKVSEAAAKAQKPKPVPKPIKAAKPAPKKKPPAKATPKARSGGDIASELLSDLDAQRAELEQRLVRVRAKVAAGNPDKWDSIGATEKQLSEIAGRRAVVERAVELRSRMAETSSVEEAIQARVLTPQQREIIKDFTGNMSTAIRRSQSSDYARLYANDAEFWDGLAAKGRDIEKAIEQNVKFRGELWRGINVSTQDAEKILSSTEFDWLGCTTSTSTELAEAKQFASPSGNLITSSAATDEPVWIGGSADDDIVAIIFHVRDGKGLAIQDIGIKAEKEVLMSGASKFKVAGKEFRDNRWFIELDQIE
jgi:chemotaxis protein histidine kinase CheA